MLMDIQCKQSTHTSTLNMYQVTDDENRKGTSYKIGDLGMVTKISDPTVEEGDVRYLPKELIDDVCIFIHLAFLSLTVLNYAVVIRFHCQ